MAAGLSRKAINDRIRRWLQREARENNGTYSKYKTVGTTSAGTKWIAYIHVMRASNGESAGVLNVEVNGVLLKPPGVFPGWQSVREALASNGLARYV